MGQRDLPLARGPAHVAAFERAGWTMVRVRGSHHMMSKEGHEATLSIPCHKGKNVKRGTLSGLIEAAGMTEEEYLGYFNKVLPRVRTGQRRS